jgi:hypothetical protein
LVIGFCIFVGSQTVINNVTETFAALTTRTHLLIAMASACVHFNGRQRINNML